MKLTELSQISNLKFQIYSIHPATLDLLEEIVHHTIQSGHVSDAWDIYLESDRGVQKPRLASGCLRARRADLPRVCRRRLVEYGRVGRKPRPTIVLVANRRRVSRTRPNLQIFVRKAADDLYQRVGDVSACSRSPGRRRTLLRTRK